jgi:hypothetical protein
VISLPSRKDLPLLGDLTIDIKAKGEEYTNLIANIESKYNEDASTYLCPRLRD